MYSSYEDKAKGELLLWNSYLDIQLYVRRRPPVETRPEWGQTMSVGAFKNICFLFWKKKWLSNFVLKEKIKSRILLAFFERFLFRFTLLQFLRCDHLKQTCILTSIDLCMSICYLLFMFVHDQNKDYLDIHISRLAGSPRFYQPKKNCIMDFLSF